MSARPSLPWLTTHGVPLANPTDALTAPVGSAAVATGNEPVTHRRDFVKLLGVGGLVIAASSLGVRRLNAADRPGAPNAEPWEPHA